ncbi:hypothetical protein N7468_005260 [Penicillium chermesinum]|uniref:RNA recognition motif-containing protein n=1 Tax=Penicillium chermesinum TaxID=63820 RepID=A0A9W9NYX0_9EURO|nr:uncharacterized protein N7468_005260 [Penicillium chermesinum]KAJ5232304.1 hypothetical protein N7468_005260 [Penicillium chermesinum]KAJ6171961.1 hypothetical protein N7470_001028 [Penicillium chermesinum]
MPPRPGEDTVLTVFADIHYYFTAPTPKPRYHRFDKSSYVYIHHDAAQKKSRFEIANHPGTAEQDAFTGALDNVHIQHSDQFPTRFTLTVDGLTGSPQPEASQYEWRLPSDDGQDLIRIHTIDMYLWTVDDANHFLDTATQFLSASQVETDGEPVVQQPEAPMSSVVQQLENIAISDPAYQNGQTRNSRSESTTVPAAVSPPQPPAQSLSFPPPPSAPAAEPQQSPQQSQSAYQTPAEEKKESPAFTPLPYNPAAPPAPEPISHREKTPPPEDGAEGTGLMAAAAADQGTPYTPPHQVGGAVGIGALSPPPTGPTGYASPPPSAGLAHASTFPLSSQPLSSPGVASFQQSFMTGQQPPQSQYQQHYDSHRSSSMSFAPPPPQPQSPPQAPAHHQDPNAHLFSGAVYGNPLSPPPVGFSNYSYDQPQQVAPGTSEYDVHTQVYRPTEAEVGSHGHKQAIKSMKAPGQRSQTFQHGASRIDSGVNRWLKKLEKKIG